MRLFISTLYNCKVKVVGFTGGYKMCTKWGHTPLGPYLYIPEVRSNLHSFNQSIRARNLHITQDINEKASFTFINTSLKFNIKFKSDGTTFPTATIEAKTCENIKRELQNTHESISSPLLALTIEIEPAVAIFEVSLNDREEGSEEEEEELEDQQSVKKNRIERSRETYYELHKTLAHAGPEATARFYSSLRGESIDNTKMKEIRDVIKTCSFCQTGKAKHSTSWNSYQTAKAVGEIQHADVMHIALKKSRNLLIMIAIDQMSKVMTASVLSDSTSYSYAKAIEEIRVKFLKEGHEVKDIYFDDDTSLHPIRSRMGVNLHLMPPGKHERRSERHIGIIRERMRTIKESLPYLLPNIWYVDMIHHIVNAWNITPSASLQWKAPIQLLRKEYQPPDEELMKLSFGDIIFVQKSPTNVSIQANDMSGKLSTKACIAAVLGTTIDGTGIARVYKLDALAGDRRVNVSINPRNYQMVLLDDKVIEAINKLSLGDRDGNPSEITKVWNCNCLVLTLRKIIRMRKLVNVHVDRTFFRIVLLIDKCLLYFHRVKYQLQLVHLFIAFIKGIISLLPLLLYFCLFQKL